jgi:hypothetical protein
MPEDRQIGYEAQELDVPGTHTRRNVISRTVARIYETVTGVMRFLSPTPAEERREYDAVRYVARNPLPPIC